MASRLRMLMAASAAVSLGLATGGGAAERRRIADADLLAFVWVADPQISPDGEAVAFVRVKVSTSRQQYESSIWMVRTDGRTPPRQLTAGPSDVSPRWSPDGSRLAFARSAEANGRPQPPQIHVMPLAGGEPFALTDMKRGAGAPEWSPDGKSIAFASTTFPEELTGASQPATAKDDDSSDTDVRVITSATYRANGVSGFGYVDPDRPSHVWTMAVPAPGESAEPPVRVTSGTYGTSAHQWSRDGSEIHFLSDRRRQPYYLAGDSDLYAVPARQGGEPRTIASIDGRIGAYAFSSDGKRLAFVGVANGRPERSYDQPDLWIVDQPGGAPRNVTASYDFDIGGSLAGDQRAPRGTLPAPPIWTSHDVVTVRVGERGNAYLSGFRASDGQQAHGGQARTPDQEVVAYSADAAARRIAAVVSTATSVGDLFVYDGPSGASPRRLTSFNEPLFSQLTLSEPEEIWYQSFDGQRIQGWILKPPDFEASKSYPLILQIHGGPHAAYGSTFTHEFQVMAARGYVVLYTNPRGSSNYGQAFGNVIQFNYPGDDYKDLMAGVDAVVKRGYIDQARMGVTGGSGGGLLTNWVVTQTSRFKAAVSQRDISDWTTFWYTADFSLFTPSWFPKAPFEDPAAFTRRSPITYVSQIQTPLMFILGDEDWRTPTSAGGEQLFRALKYLKRPVVMVRFPGESHELSRSGRPRHRVERLQHIVAWFDKYLLGTRITAYDER